MRTILFVVSIIIEALMFKVSAYTSQENVTINVGETRTLYLPNSVTDLNPYSVGFYTLAPEYVDVIGHTKTSLTIKGLKAFSSPAYVRCDYYYMYNGRAYGGGYNYKVTVKGNNSDTGYDKGGFYLNEHDITISIGEERKIEYSFEGKIDKVTWQYGGPLNNPVAYVDQNGNVKGLSKGTAPIYAKTSYGRYDVCYITVTDNTYAPDPQLKDGDLISNLNTTIEGHNISFSVLSAVEKTAQTGFSINGVMYNSMGVRDVNTVTIPSYIKEFRVEKIDDYSLGLLGIDIPFEIILPPTIKFLGKGAFQQNKNLCNIQFPANIDLIPSQCLLKCENIKSIIIPDNVTKVEALAFSECLDLEDITFGVNVSVIDWTVFLNCPNLKRITITNPKCPEIKEEDNPVGIFAWGNNYWSHYENVILYVPEETIDDYRNNNTWRKFSNITAISTSGVGEIIGEPLDTPVEYYNLQGIRMSDDNLPAGVYITRQGNKTAKVLVK